MKKSRLVSIIIAVIVALLLAGGGFWFWSVGSVEAEFLPSIRLQASAGSVSYKAAGSSDWKTVSDVVEVHSGDSVKTATSSEAQILWGDLGVTRVDENSEIVIDSAPADASGENAVISLKVNAGRVWNRMLKLLDVGSSMEVKTSDVVATVRGTSFGIIKNATDTETAVSESVVGMNSANGGDETLLSDNEWGAFGNDGKPRQVRKLNDKDLWPAEQRKKDERFDRDYLADMRKRFDQRVARLPQVPGWIRNASESLHLAVSGGEGKQQLALAYARVHLALGDTEGVRARLAAAGDKAGNLRAEIHAMATLLNRTRATPDRVETFRGLRDALAKSDPANQAYRGLVRIDERIDDYLFGDIDPSKKTEIAGAIINSLDQAEADIKAGNLGDARLTEKTKALRKRLGDALGMAPEDLPKPEVPVVPVTPTSKPTVRLNEPTLNPPVIQQAPLTRLYQRIQLLASPTTIVLGSTVTLSMFGIQADGQAVDITSQTGFSSSGGSISGAVFTPSVVGAVTVTGSFTDDQGTRTASAVVTVNKTAVPQGVYLKSVSVTLTGPSSVACGVTFPFKVMGTYSDGSVKDVTIMAKTSSSDPKMLYVGAGTASSSCPSDPQITVYINASVTDKMTQTGSTPITIMRDPNGSKTCPVYMARYGGC